MTKKPYLILLILVVFVFSSCNSSPTSEAPKQTESVKLAKSEEANSTETTTQLPKETNTEVATTTETTTTATTTEPVATTEPVTTEPTTAPPTEEKTTIVEAKKTTTAEPAKTPEPAQETAQASEPTEAPKQETKKISDADMKFNSSFSVKANIKNVISSLGEPQDYSETISCNYDGLDKIYTYNGVEFYTYPDGDQDLIMEISLTDGTYTTSRGITISSTKDDVIAKYGDDFETVGKSIVYRTGKGGLSFSISDNLVKSISWIE